MSNTENDIKKALENIKKIEKREEDIENIIFEYLTKNRFFKEEELLEKLESLIQEGVNNGIQNYKSILIKDKKTEEDIDIYLKHEKESLLKRERDNIINFNVPRIARKNRILLEPHVLTEDIIILRGEEAEFFVFIFYIYGNTSDNYITKEAIIEAEKFLEIELKLENLIKDKILTKYGPGMSSIINCVEREDVFKNKEIENLIFIYITTITMNKEIKMIREKINESNIKINQSNEKIEESSERIQEAEEKIVESNKRIEKGKIDTVSLLGIFVAIISIIYANISVSISNELSSIVITNISTVVCILFLLGFIEKSIKNENNKIPIVVIWGISLFISLILIIGMYSYMRYEKNNFIKYMENIYELKNKETTLELQYFTMPSDY